MKSQYQLYFNIKTNIFKKKTQNGKQIFERLNGTECLPNIGNSYTCLIVEIATHV
jgi:hypothetical protein